MVYFLVFVKRTSRRPASLRHVTKNPSPQLLYFPHLQNRDARNSFRFCSYVNWRVSPALFSLSLSSHSPYTLPFDFQLSTVNLFPSNSFPLNPFADPHPLNPVASILYKNIGGQGVSIFTFSPQSPITSHQSRFYPNRYLSGRSASNVLLEPAGLPARLFSGHNSFVSDCVGGCDG